IRSLRNAFSVTVLALWLTRVTSLLPDDLLDDYAESAMERTIARAHNPATHRSTAFRCCGLLTWLRGRGFAGSEISAARLAKRWWESAETVRGRTACKEVRG